MQTRFQGYGDSPPPQTSFLQTDDALGEEEHGKDDADGEYDGDDDRELVQVLLHNAGSSAGVIQGAGDHVGNAGALTGMHQDQSDQRDRGKRPYGEEKNLERTHIDSFEWITDSPSWYHSI